MEYTLLTQNTLIPQFPSIINNNNAAFKRYLDVIYNETAGVVVVPVNTTGKVKGAMGEFVTCVVDNLIVKKQYTNMWENITTANYDYWVTYTGVQSPLRDASATLWENAGYKYIDVQKPYYKILPFDNSTATGNYYALKTDNKSQIVQLVLDASGTVDGFYRILVDPCANYLNPANGYLDIQIDASALALDQETKWVSFFCLDYDASFGAIWAVYQYGDAAPGSAATGGTGGGVTPAYVNGQIAAALVPYALNVSVNSALTQYATTAFVNTSFASNSSLGMASVLSIKTNASIGNLYIFNAAQEASIANLYAFNVKQEASIANLYAFNVKQEASISNLYTFNTSQEASISNLYTRVNYVDSCLGVVSGLVFKMNTSSGEYATNSSIATASFATNVSVNTALATMNALHIIDSSLSNDFMWTAGYLEVSLGSLHGFDQLVHQSEYRIHDVSIGWLTLNKQAAGSYLAEGSVGTSLYWHGGVFDVSSTFDYATVAYVDGSLVVLQNQTLGLDYRVSMLENSTGTCTFEYVDGSLAFRDASLNFLFDGKYSSDASLSWLTSRHNVTEVSLGFITGRYNITENSLAYYVNRAQVDASFATNASVNAAFTTNVSANAAFAIRDGNLSTTNGNLNTLLGRHNKTEVSLGYITSRYNISEVSLGWLTLKNNVVESSLGTLTTRHNITESSLGTLTSRHDITEVSLGTLTSRHNITESSLGVLTVSVNASIARIDGSLNYILPLSKYVNSSSYYDGSLNAKVSKIGDVMTGQLSISNYGAISLDVSGNIRVVTGDVFTHNVSTNTRLGADSLNKNTTGKWNVATGAQSMMFNTVGENNVAVGYAAIRNNSDGYYNVGVGFRALWMNYNGDYNIAVGGDAMLFNTLGGGNVGIGYKALYNSSSGSYNVAIGDNAALLVRDGSINYDTNNSIYIGAGTKSYVNGANNQIVIGYNAIGAGNNTVTLGNDSVTSTLLKGKVGVAKTAAYVLDVSGAVRFDGSLNMNNKQIKYLAAPTDPSDAVTKAYADGLGSGTPKTFQNLTISGSTFTWNIANGYNAKLILSTNASINITNASSGDSGTLIVMQDGSGGRLLSLPPNSLKNAAWVLSDASMARDVISFLYDGSNYYWNKGGPYS